MRSAATRSDPSASQMRQRWVRAGTVLLVALGLLAGLWGAGWAGYWPGGQELRAAAEQLEEWGADGCSSVEAEADWLRGRVVVTRDVAKYLANAGGIMAEVPDGSRSVEEQIEARLRRAGFDVEVERDGKFLSVSCEF